ncbi:monocarboxylate permease-like protein [Hypoxylon sp. FL1857]|nr:monocarboxylate permease-like protein [Hypoxylon sp. FL1857]
MKDTTDDSSVVVPNTLALNTEFSPPNEALSKEASPMPVSTPVTFPEGGAKAWGVAIGASLALFSTLGYVNSFGVYQAYYVDELLSQESPSRISWIGSLQFYFVFASGAIGGPLFDRYGSKIIFPFAIAYVLSIMLTSICHEYYQFVLAQGVLSGVANGAVTTPAVAATSQYFHKKRGAAIGLAIAGSSLGGVVFPLALSRMLENKGLGFGWTVRIVGFIILGLISIACALIKERLPSRKTRLFLPRAFTERKYNCIIVSGFFLFLGMLTPFFYLPAYAQSRARRLIPGILSDKFGRFNMYLVAAVSTAILLFCWTLCTSQASIIAFTVLYGLSSGGIISGNSINLASVTDDPKNIGTYIGQAVPIISIASLIGPPINGAFLDTFKGFWELSIFNGVACILGACGVVASKSVTKEGVFSKA